jgi:hypothetical protein
MALTAVSCSAVVTFLIVIIASLRLGCADGAEGMKLIG